MFHPPGAKEASSSIITLWGPYPLLRRPREIGPCNLGDSCGTQFQISQICAPLLSLSLPHCMQGVSLVVSFRPC